MASRAFRLIEADREAGCRVLEVEGELDLAVAGELQNALEGLPAGSRVLIRLERCEFIDSTGIALILREHHRLAAEGGRVAVVGPASQVLRVLSLSGLTENGLVFETFDEALAGCDEDLEMPAAGPV